MKPSELRPDPEKVRAWQQRSRDTAIERARGREGMKSLQLRAAKPESLRAPSMKRSRRSPRDRWVPRDWTRRVFEMHGAVCVVTGQRAVQAHHAIPVQTLVQRGLAQHAGDPRNGVPVSKRVHERHEQAVERILVACLPQSVFEFAADHGLEWYLERQQIYPRVPPAWKGRLC